MISVEIQAHDEKERKKHERRNKITFISVKL